MAKLFILYWIVSGIVSLFWGCTVIHAPGNFKKFREDIKELAEESQIPIEIMFAIAYASFVVFGFVGVPVALYRRLVRRLKKND